MSIKVTAIPILILAVFCMARPAQAYLDPGTGSYILQTLLGVGFGIVYAARGYIRQVPAYLKHLLGRKDKAPNTK